MPPFLQEIVDAIVLAIEHSVTDFRSHNPTEMIYGFALVPSGVGDHVHCAIATEERLNQCAEAYKNNLDLESKKQWLRWANPDDGWYQDTFTSFTPVSHKLAAAIDSGQLSEFDDEITNMLCAALKQVSDRGLLGSDVVLSVTHGEDPQEFVYWSPKINAPELHQKLEREYAISQDVESRLVIDT